jgi:pyruvate-ferredoxin/flavodoxin oxidoreductase
MATGEPDAAASKAGNAEHSIMDGNTAVAHVAYRVNEVISIYPITPSSTMAELADEWAATGIKNIWGNVPLVQEMQSEAGAAGTVHGALQAGSLTTTFTASQGLLLMIPNMFKIAGELTPAVFHVAARTVATQALSIFGDHSDVMAVRTTGFAELSSGSVQEAHDLALVAQAATLESRIPFLHFFDGFRTSHELNTLSVLDDAQIRAMIDDQWVRAHRARALNPEHPFIRGTAHNPDTFFQARESANPYYERVPGIVEQTMARFGALTGRQYRLFEYIGCPDADRVIILMGSGAQTAAETAKALRSAGERVGVIQVHLFRPFSAAHFLDALPATCRALAVLEQTKEPGAPGEPLYLDVVVTLAQAVAGGKRALMPTIIGGRYGLSSKDFNPPMAKAVFDELRKRVPKNGFTVGIDDDVAHTSLAVDPGFWLKDDQVVEAVFYGLGADGTVGANKNTAKILAEDAHLFSQAYFVYDSHKSGAQTVSHLRFGKQPIHAPYLISAANFVACHQFQFLQRLDVLNLAAPGATFLLNCPYPPDAVWERLPGHVQRQIVDKQLHLYVIDASSAARETGLGGQVNTVLQTCFFSLSGVLPVTEAIDQIKQAIRKSYAKKGEEAVQRNFRAVDQTLQRLHAVQTGAVSGDDAPEAPVADRAPEFVRRFTGPMLQALGDRIPVSLMPVDGTYPSGTAAWEKRNIASDVPAWDRAMQLCLPA